MGQGNDRGTQYRSGIYCFAPGQKELAEASKTAYEASITKHKSAQGDMITTEIIDPAPTFYIAEDYHQQYLAKPGNRQYVVCFSCFGLVFVRKQPFVPRHDGRGTCVCKFYHHT
jgi:peptide methionine sulfoxide reductase MsrA